MYYELVLFLVEIEFELAWKHSLKEE
jgi:hypothetical protein